MSEMEGGTETEEEQHTEFMEERMMEQSEDIPEPPPPGLPNEDNNDNELETSERVEIDDESESEGEEDSSSLTDTHIPVGRIKKIMKICLATNEEESDDGGDVEEPKSGNSRAKKTKGKGKGKGKGPTTVTGPILLNREAILLTAVATERFISAVSNIAAAKAASFKKKTISAEHLKLILGESEAFDFLQGCFQPL